MTGMVLRRKFGFVPANRFKRDKTLYECHFVPQKRFRWDKMWQP